MLLDPISPLLPVCPASPHLIKHIAYPSLSLIWLFLAVLSLIYGLVIAFKFNTVKVFKRVIHRDEISNTYWIILFLVFCLKDILQCAKYAVGFPEHETMSSLFSLAVALMNAIAALCLSLALLHQFRWRTSSKKSFDMESGDSHASYLIQSFQSDGSPISASETVNGSLGPAKQVRWSAEANGKESRDYRHDPAPVASTHYVSETTPFFRSSPQYTRLQWLKRFLISFEMLFFLLLALYIVFVFILTTNTSKIIYWVAVALYIAQRLPILILTAVIVAKGFCTSFDSEEAQGPSFWSRFLLILAVLFDSVIEVPVNTWSLAFGSYGCVIKVASVVDLLFLTGAISYTLFFVFLTKEFKRNVDACLWGATFNAAQR
jgi:hypothetical protein